MSKMLTREVIGTVILVRDGQRKVLTTGMKFDFTEDEVAEIVAANPKALSSKTIVDLDEGDANPKDLPDAPAAPAGKGRKAKGGSDEEM